MEYLKLGYLSMYNYVCSFKVNNSKHKNFEVSTNFLSRYGPEYCHDSICHYQHSLHTIFNQAEIINTTLKL